MSPQPSSEPFKGFDHLSPGASFVRGDLHMHTHGVSTDVRDAEMTLPRVLDVAKERELELIAITDHNAIDGVAELLSEAPKNGLTAFAGVEVTAAEGHVLVYFAAQNYTAFEKLFNRRSNTKRPIVGSLERPRVVEPADERWIEAA